MRASLDSRSHMTREWAWKPFEPSRTRPWTLATVAHLHRRAGFAPSWERAQARPLGRALLKASTGSLKGEPKSAVGTPASELEATLEAMAAQLAPSADLARIQAIWLYRMIFTPHPLRERMTLFWHNHFATSNLKVQSPLLMQRQNDLFRAHALGDFRRLAEGDRQGSGDADLAGFDDQPQGEAERELRPRGDGALHAGRGHYTEQDIQEAARAFTGWFVVRDQFEEVPRQHDGGPKSILGQTGNFDGDDIPAHPAQAAGVRRIHLRQALPLFRQRDRCALRRAAGTAGGGVS